MIKALILSTLSIFTITSHAQQQQIPLTDCNHPSNWCKEIRDVANKSYIYAQIAFNSYEKDKQFVLPPRYKTKSSIPMMILDLHTQLLKNMKEINLYM